MLTGCGAGAGNGGRERSGREAGRDTDVQEQEDEAAGRDADAHEHADTGIGAAVEGPLEVGDTVEFGHYEQDNDTSNGPEEIEWEVLACEDGKALLISRYILDGRQFDSETASEVCWENSDIREWMNGEFVEEAFTDDEYDAILDTELSTHDLRTSGNEYYTTTDRVFLMSNDDMIEYYDYIVFNEDTRQGGTPDLMCEATEYAQSHNVYNFVYRRNEVFTMDHPISLDGRCSSMYWLRDSGNCYALIMGLGGTTGDWDRDQCSSALPYYRNIDNDEMGVRPAIWVRVSE